MVFSVPPLLPCPQCGQNSVRWSAGGRVQPGVPDELLYAVCADPRCGWKGEHRDAAGRAQAQHNLTHGVGPIDRTWRPPLQEQAPVLVPRWRQKLNQWLGH